MQKKIKDDTISRQAAIEVVKHAWAKGLEPTQYLEELPAVQTCEDAVSRAAAIDAVKKNTFRLTFAEERNCEGRVAWSAEAVYSDVMEGALLELPSAQPEIIACGDCKHWICHDRRCGYWNHGVKPLDWCCHAERRTDE